MTDQPPELVATASLSPLSPEPIHPLTTVVSKLKDHAAATEHTVPDPILTPAGPRPDSDFDMGDTIVVAGDSSEESDNDSLDAYGEEEQLEQSPEAEASPNDAAKSSQSPPSQSVPQVHDVAGVTAEPDQAGDALSDVSEAPESLNSPSAPPDFLRPRSPPPTASATLPEQVPASPAQSNLPHINGSTADVSSASEPASPEGHQILCAGQDTKPIESLNGDATTTDDPVFSNAETHVTAETAGNISADSGVSAPGGLTEEDDAAVQDDIARLVGDLTGTTTAKPSLPPVSPPAPAADPVPGPEPPAAVLSTLSTPHPASLPPKPALPQQPARLPPFPGHHGFPTKVRPGSSMPSARPATLDGSRGTYRSAPHTQGPNDDATEFYSFHGRSGSNRGAHHMHGQSDHAGDQSYESFLADEKQYTAEAKWDRFPPGSRVFLGNLNNERVPKRAVFEVFRQYGRIAQISLKAQYGFVQYYTGEEANRAIFDAQGIELGGRAINLEISKDQSKKGFRERSQERRPQYDSGDSGYGHGRGSERSGGRAHGRDDFRRQRSPSPRRGHARNGRDGPSHGRDQFGGAHDRRRSRSPQRHSRFGSESYRRRSPSPRRGRAALDPGRAEVPRRHGADVPDVQFLLFPDVAKDFVVWVEDRFKAQRLRTSVMSVNPRFSRDEIVQRQVLEGVHAIVDLDPAAWYKGKINMQLFKRSGGSHVSFDKYEDLQPDAAAAVVAHMLLGLGLHHHQQQQQPQQPSYAPPASSVLYGNLYQANGGAAAPTPAPAPHAAAYPYGFQQTPHLNPHNQPAAAPPPGVQQADLQAILASLSAGHPQPAVAPLHHAQPTMGPPAAAPPVDISALMNNLKSVAANPQVPTAYGAVPPNYGTAVPGIYSPSGTYPPSGTSPSHATYPSGNYPPNGSYPPDTTQQKLQ